jgi:lia operon protein LiaG
MSKIGRVSLSLTAISIITLGLALGIFFPWGNLQALGQGESGIMENINEERSYDLKNIKDLDISVSSAEIRIKVVNSNTLSVHLHGSSSGKKPFLEDNKSGSSLIIEVKREPGIGFSNSNLKLDIEIPEGYNRNLKLNCSSGDISIPDIELQDLRVDMSSGNLDLKSLTVKNFIFDSSSGRITAEKIESDKSDLKLSSGSVKINKFTGDLEAKMSSGNLQVEYLDFDNRVSIDNSSGDIIIALPSEANFELDADTSSGKIICDFPITVLGGQDRDQLKGTVGRGINIINVETSSGDISILKN